MELKSFRVTTTTREYLQESVAVPDSGLELTDVDVWMALLAVGVDPQSSDWVAGTWFVDGLGVTWGRVKLGDDLPLSQGIWKAWIKVDLGDEIPVREFALVYVT